MKICYAGTDTLYVPATQLDLVSKYVGAGEDKPVRLSRMGGGPTGSAQSPGPRPRPRSWPQGLIKLYAERVRQQGQRLCAGFALAGGGLEDARI